MLVTKKHSVNSPIVRACNVRIVDYVNVTMHIPYMLDQRLWLLNHSFCWLRRLQFEATVPANSTTFSLSSKVLFTYTNSNSAMRKSFKSTNKLLPS